MSYVSKQIFGPMLGDWTARDQFSEIVVRNGAGNEQLVNVASVCFVRQNVGGLKGEAKLPCPETNILLSLNQITRPTGRNVVIQSFNYLPPCREIFGRTHTALGR